MRKSWTFLGLMSVFGLGIAMSGPVQAGDVVLFRAAAPPPDELAAMMFPQAQGEMPAVRTRGLHYGGGPPAGEAKTGSAAASGGSPPAEGDIVAFNISFALNSAELQPESFPYLDSIGRVLVHERPQARIAITGHADARGDAIFNMRLSQRRAEAVREYLWGKFDIGPERMAVIGYGESSPLPGTDPYDGINRRVEFQPLG